MYSNRRLGLIDRYAGVPVDFEEVNINPNTEGNEDLEYAITSIRRNGVALKGKPFITLLITLITGKLLMQNCIF